jgi:hypothetical protein
MPLAMGRVMNTMRIFAVVLVTLLTVTLVAFPIAEATPPATLQRFPSSGTTLLGPGENRTFSWVLRRNISEFLFYYDVTGDELDVYIDDMPFWVALTGKGWRFCDGCEFSPGTYDVMALSPYESTQFYFGFYTMPLPPVEFSGFIPADSYEAFNEFAVIFPPSSANYTLLLGATGGSYDFFVDDALEATVPETTTLSLDLGGDFHRFTADATGAGVGVTWTIEIQGPPKLDVAIVYPESGGCDTILNPEAGQSVCVAGAEATPSDDGSPTITYQWTKSGGEFNSTTSQWVEWTAPPGVARFTLTVKASAEGYVSGSDSLSVQVEPEFPSFVAPLLLMLALGFTAIAQRRSRNRMA